MDMTDIKVSGHAATGFEPVRDLLARHLREGVDLGVSLAVTIDGVPVVDLQGGFADRAGARPVGADTLFRIYSCTKAIGALVIARLVDKGALSYETRVAELWPEFAAEGKASVTIGQALSHQAGLAGVKQPWTRDDWLDWDKTVARLAEMAPLWPPGTASGYHPITWGHLAGEIARRADGRSLGTQLREDVCAPLGLDYQIGLASPEWPRAIELTPPKGFAEFGEITEIKRLAFLERWAAPPGRPPEAFMSFELASNNGYATAMAAARLMEPFARDGRLGETQILSPDGVEAVCAEQISGEDLVLAHDLSFGAGVIRARPGRPVYGPGARTIGHTGYGGSFVMADPERRLTAAFFVTKLNPTLVSDPRMRAVLDAIYACL